MMLDSLHRVLGTKDSDWQISKQPSNMRYQEGLEEMKRGQRTGFAKSMYARVFYPNGGKCSSLFGCFRNFDIVSRRQL